MRRRRFADLRSEPVRWRDDVGHRPPALARPSAGRPSWRRMTRPVR